MPLPALDTAFASIEDLPQKQVLATWLANKTGGTVADVLTLSEKQLWAELAVAYGGSLDVAGYEGIALQYSWGAIYNGITGGTDIQINWGIRQAMEAIVGAQFGVDVCCYTTGLPIKYLLALMALSVSPGPVEVDGLAFDDGVDSGALLYDDGDTGLLLYA